MAADKGPAVVSVATVEDKMTGSVVVTVSQEPKEKASNPLADQRRAPHSAQ